MNKLSIQDLAMFIGSDVEIQHAEFPENYKQFFAKTGDVVKIEPILLLSIRQGYVKVKPILRPLSDMTKKEKLECAEILGGASHLCEESKVNQAGYLLTTNSLYVSQTNIPGIKWMQLTKFLISKHFDVLGWIEIGLAIDKTKK